MTANYYVPTPLPGVKGDMEEIRVFYLLRIDPGGARPATLTRLGIAAQPSTAFVDGFALSPDGRTLAVLEWRQEPDQIDKGTPATLTLYSVATGKALHTWTGGLAPHTRTALRRLLPVQRELRRADLAAGRQDARVHLLRKRPGPGHQDA